MKVFLAATSLATSYGGPAYSVSRLAVALAELGVDVGLWSADGTGAGSTLLGPSSRVTLLDGTAEAALDRFGEPDVIHDNGIWLGHNHRLAVLARKRGIPRVVSLRGMLEPWAIKHKGMKKRAAWAAYQKRDLMMASVHHASTDVEAANIKALELGVPISVVPNGVDLPDLSGADPHSADSSQGAGVKTALYLGRIYPIKGLPMLIEAWGRAKPPGWRLRIVGPDEAGHLAVVQRAVKECRLEDVVSFGPAVSGDAKRREMLGADLFVLPTHSESFGMAVAEALAYSIPVLTTLGAPWPELVTLQCGWRVNPDAIDLTRGLIEATGTDLETLRAMGARGRRLVADKYQWGAVARKMLRLYEEAR